MRAPEGASAILVSVDRYVKPTDRRPLPAAWEPEPLLLPLDVPQRQRQDHARQDDEGDDREPGVPGSVVIVIDLA